MPKYNCMDLKKMGVGLGLIKYWGGGYAKIFLHLEKMLGGGYVKIFYGHENCCGGRLGLIKCWRGWSGYAKIYVCEKMFGGGGVCKNIFCT